MDMTTMMPKAISTAASPCIKVQRSRQDQIARLAVRRICLRLRRTAYYCNSRSALVLVAR